MLKLELPRNSVSIVVELQLPLRSSGAVVVVVGVQKRIVIVVVRTVVIILPRCIHVRRPVRRKIRIIVRKIVLVCIVDATIADQDAQPNQTHGGDAKEDHHDAAASIVLRCRRRVVVLARTSILPCRIILRSSVLKVS